MRLKLTWKKAWSKMGTPQKLLCCGQPTLSPSFLTGRGRRAVQVVCRLYETVQQILIGFDLDCSAVAYDGQKVYASPRAIAAFATRINKVHIDRRSPSYEHRLFKYTARGFKIFVQELDRMRINPVSICKSRTHTHTS